MPVRPNEVLIDDSNAHKFFEPFVNGERKTHGLIPRDWHRFPCGSLEFMPQATIPKIPRSEWSARIKELTETKSLLSDKRNVGGDNGSRIPSRDQNGKGFCLPPGTLIRMSDGTQKPIEQMQLLDGVLTAEGNISTVRQCHARDYNGKLVKIKTYGHSHLKCTPNHRILTKRGYVPAGELTTDDWLCVPRYAPSDHSVVLTASHVTGTKRRIKNINGEAAWRESLPETWHKNCNHIPDAINLNKATGRIFGLWLAEGYFDNGSVMWCFGTHEKETLVSELTETLRAEWGLEATVKVGPVPTVTLVEINGKLWRQLFESLLGKGAGSKRIHSDLARGNKEFLEGLFWGWMSGDGCSRGRRGKAYKCGATVSHNLAMNLYDIANSIGLTPSINRERPQVNKYAKKRRHVWKIQVNPNPSEYRNNYRLEAEATKVWRKVYKLDYVEYNGMVFNIGVEGDNSYVAEGISVHNCWAHSTVSAALLSRAASNQPYVSLSAYAIACIIKGYRDEGGWNAESAEFMRNIGCPSEQFWPQQSMSSSNDNSNMRANAALHKLVEWDDIPDKDFDTLMTYLLLGFPAAIDLNWWSHSVCAADPVEIEPGSFGVRIWNSWGDSWSDAGMGVLTESKARPDGAIAQRATWASPV